MNFESEIFVDIETAKKFHKTITTKEATEKRIIIAHRFNSNTKTKESFLLGVNKLLKEYNYETFVGLYPDFDKKNPLRIEEIIVTLRVLINHFQKENCLSLLRLTRNLEDIAKKTYASRYCYRYLGV